MSNLQETLLLAQVVRSGSETQTTQQSTTTSSNATQEAEAPKQGMGQLLNMAAPLLLVVVIYFLIFRPQQKREKERQSTIKKIAKGDKVLTRGGIYGTVIGTRLEEELLIVKIADGVKVELHSNAIDSVNPDNTAQKAGNKK